MQKGLTMKKHLHYHIDLDNKLIFYGLMLMISISTMAQNTRVDTSTNASVQGVRMIDVDLSPINPRYPILFSDAQDTIIVYERNNDNTLVVYDKYVYDKVAKRWFPINDNGRPCVKIKKRRNKGATIVYLKPIKNRTKSKN